MKIPPRECERPDSLGPANLVRRDENRVSAQRQGAHLQAAQRLHGVADQQPASLMGQRRRLGDRLDHACFIVRGLKRHQRPASDPAQQGLQRAKIEPPLRIHRRAVDPLGPKTMALQHAGMLASADDEIAHPSGGVLQAGGQHQIGRLGAPRCEGDIAGVCPQGARHLPPRLVDHAPRRPSLAMDGGGIARQIKGQQHGFARLAAQRGGGVVVEIDAFHRQGGRPLRVFRQSSCIRG